MHRSSTDPPQILHSFPLSHICANLVQIFTVVLRIKDFKQGKVHLVVATLAPHKDKENKWGGEASCQLAQTESGSQDWGRLKVTPSPELLHRDFGAVCF